MRNHLKFTICLVFGALLLLGAAPAYAAPPTWFTPPAATTVNPNSADVFGALTPNRANTTCYLEYGTTTAYGNRADCTNGPFSGTSMVLAHALPRDLNAQTTYHMRMVATNADGTAVSPDRTFTTPTGAPLIENNGFVGVLFLTDTTAEVAALFKPNGLATSCVVEYGTTAAYGNLVNCTQTPFGVAEVTAEADLPNLTSATTYHYRMDLQNDAGVTRSADRTFTTCAAPPESGGGTC